MKKQPHQLHALSYKLPTTFKLHLSNTMLYADGYLLANGWPQLIAFAESYSIEWRRPNGREDPHYAVRAIIAKLALLPDVRHKYLLVHRPIVISAASVGIAANDPRAMGGLVPFLPTTKEISRDLDPNLAPNDRTFFPEEDEMAKRVKK